MTTRFFPPSSWACVFAALWLGVAAARSQETELETLVDRSLAAMGAEKWREALDLGTEAVARFGKDDPLRIFGPQFGALYYRNGICQMKLGNWEEAMRSMEICYRDFPDDNAPPGRENVFREMALLKWGEAAMGAGKWELALGNFRKFLEERDRSRDAYPQGAFYINMAVCHYRLGRIPDGNENLEIAVRNKRVFPTPDAGIFAGLEMLVKTAVAAKNEQALLDFMEKNRGGLMIRPALMQRYSGVLLKLAGETLAADMRRAALVLYQFVPSSEVALDDARFLLASASPSDSALLQQEVASMEAGDSNDIVKLAGVALLHEKAGNLRGAFAAYEQLEHDFPKARNREENLYHLVRTASQAAGPGALRKYAEAFLADFPQSPRAAEISGWVRP